MTRECYKVLYRDTDRALKSALLTVRNSPYGLTYEPGQQTIAKVGRFLNSFPPGKDTFDGSGFELWSGTFRGFARPMCRILNLVDIQHCREFWRNPIGFWRDAYGYPITPDGTYGVRAFTPTEEEEVL